MFRFTTALLTAALLMFPFNAMAEPDESDLPSSGEIVVAAVTEQPTTEDVETMEPVVVTATRVETPVREIGSSVTVITAEEIERQQATTVSEALRGTPGLDVVQQGGPGKVTSVFLRGAKSEHTLVLIDGIEVNDVSSTGRGFNFANLPTENIERIEILRGPQSTLYGSDAIGGVINIITKKGKGAPSFYVSGEYGSFNTFRESAGVSGGNELLNYSASIWHTDTDGISAANKKDGNDERDGYKETAVSTRLGLTPMDNLSFDFFLNYSDAWSEVDDAFGVPIDDPNSTQDTESLFLRTQATVTIFDELWEQTFGVSYSDTDRDLSDDPNVGELSGFDMTTEGELIKFDWQHNFYVHETNTLTLGVETEEEQMMSKDSFGGYQKDDARTTGYYVQDQIKLWDAFFTTIGVRVDDHEEFGSETTFRIASAYIFKDTGTKIKGSYGEGFKAPTLYQLFGPGFPGYPIGNPDLKPEKSKGWDVGIEQELFDGKVTLGATYFENRFEDLIDFVDFVGYINRSKAEAEGVELFASINPCENLSVAANYTYTDTEDKTTGGELPRRAKDKAGVDINYRFHDRGNLNLGIVYVGDRLNLVGGERVGGYTLVNLAATYDINEHLQWFARIDNLFDRDYEEVAGYGTPGFSVFSGLKLMF